MALSLKLLREQISQVDKGKARIPYISWTTAGICSALWCLMIYVHGVEYLQTSFTEEMRRTWGGFSGYDVLNGEVWRFLTSMVVHGSTFHFINNLVGIVVIMPMGERLFGYAKSLAVYLVAELTVSMLTLFLYPDEVSVGISTVLTAVIGLFTAYQIFFMPVIPQRRFPYWAMILILLIAMYFSGGYVLAHMLGFGIGFGAGWLLLQRDYKKLEARS